MTVRDEMVIGDTELAAQVKGKEPLTMEEVEKLEDGAQVIITWSGGNGPWQYTVRTTQWGPAAMSDWEVEHDKVDLHKLMTLVGSEKFHTHVWLAEEQRNG